MMLAADGVIASMNPVLRAVWGDDAIGRRLAEVVAPAAAGATAADLEAIIAAVRADPDGAWRGEVRRVDVPVEAGVWEMSLGAAGEGLVAVVRDVRDRHLAERARLDFLSMVTHDIKGPLTVILGYTELLSDPEERPSPAMLADTLGRIRESGEQIHALVSNFVELARIEAGSHRVDLHPVDLGEVVARLVANHAPRARRKGVELVLEEGTVPLVPGDRPQLERVLLNLLGNAIKYTPKGGGIVLRVAASDAAVTVSVQDTGPGIAAADLGGIFERYRRAAATRVEGVGLGLFIARTIARAHGGDVAVVSAPGEGSTFTLQLPRA
ncbi:MAG: HAMP domain-containing histidine kinase [bacterium]|nr:HAMP domain-containing histidine kinase [bacterium]